MDRISLQAEERIVLGKKVKRLRKDGKLPGHVYGSGIDTEHVAVDTKGFVKVYEQAGETGLIDLKIGSEKIRPVLIRGVQYDPVESQPLHIDFYQVNLKEKVTVNVPIVILGGDDLELVKSGEAIVLQTLNEVELEALPTDLIENIEVDVSTLKAIDDAITVGQLNFDRSKLTINVDEEEIVVKLAPAISEEMQKLLEEQAAEQAAAAEAAETEEGAEKPEGEEGEEAGEEPAEGEEAKESEGEQKSEEESKE